jgi:hypothetical protein
LCSFLLLVTSPGDSSPLKHLNRGNQASIPLEDPPITFEFCRPPFCREQNKNKRPCYDFAQDSCSCQQIATCGVHGLALITPIELSMNSGCKETKIFSLVATV